MAFDVKQFKDIFLSEAEDHLEKMNGNLLALEKNIESNYVGKILQSPIQQKDSALLDELMRSAHTIKSSAATMGYVKMAFFTHVLEDVFDYTRNKIIALELSSVNTIFEGLDALKASLKSVKEQDAELDVEAISKKIKEITGVATEGMGKSMRDDQGRPIVETIQKIETTVQTRAETPVKAVEEKVGVDTEQISHIKVPVDRLDKLMDLTEEILIDKMRIVSIIEETLQQSVSIADISKRNAMLSIKPSVDHLSRLLSSLQYGVMQIRLVPVGNIFSRFPRMIRDLSKSKNKEVELVLKGEDLEVDRSILDKLGEPLVHLLRNAVDHGIEKNGTILLEARRERDSVYIMVEDDGAGISWSGVVEAAMRKGILEQSVGETLLKKIKDAPQAEWQRDVEPLLFVGRLSTNAQVTETSGRGVGVSVVKNFVQEIGGSLYIESPVENNQGTRFILELPLTLAITEALLVHIQNHVFAIPLSSIQRVVKVLPENVKSMGDQDVAIVDDEEVPLVNLEKIFGFFASGAENVKEQTVKSSGKTVVLTRRGRDVAGVIVDKVLHQQQIIIKPLPGVLKGVKGFSGSTILGDGEVVLIVDVVSLLKNTNDLIRIS